MLMALDEVTQICPVPLPNWMADSAGKGILIVAVCHGLAQLEARWDSAGARAIWDTAGIKVILGGVADPDTLDRLSRLCGEIWLRMHSRSWYDDGRRARTATYQPVRVLPPELLRALPEWRALIIRGNLSPSWSDCGWLGGGWTTAMRSVSTWLRDRRWSPMLAVHSVSGPKSIQRKSSSRCLRTMVRGTPRSLGGSPMAPVNLPRSRERIVCRDRGGRGSHLPIPGEQSDRPTAGSRRIAALAVLAVQINELRQGAKSLKAKVDVLSKTQREQSAVVDGIGELRHQVDQILDLLSEEEESTRPWFWLTMPEQEREEKRSEVFDWVETVLRTQYSTYLTDQVRPCWPHHPEAMWELAWLYQLWSAAYLGKRAVLKDAADWHDRWAPGVIRRLGHVMEPCERACLRGRRPEPEQPRRAPH